MIKINSDLYVLKIILINLTLLILFICIISCNNKKDYGDYFSDGLKHKDYTNNKFLILQHTCSTCGLFSFFKVSLGCINKYLSEGFIPIVDIKSYPNVVNGFNTIKSNYWELFFEQPWGYTLDEVLKNAKYLETLNYTWEKCKNWPDPKSMPFEEVKRYYWHNIARKYVPIKKNLLDLTNKLMNKLFKNSKNILGVLARGTDYISMKPKNHPVQPNISDIINDTKIMDDKYDYDYIFFSSEDEIYRNKFSKSFPNKIKQINSKIVVNYNYSRRKYLGYNDNVKGNIEYNKIIILSKCLDIITVRCNGSAGIFILSKGFRNAKIYNLGIY